MLRSNENLWKTLGYLCHGLTINLDKPTSQMHQFMCTYKYIEYNSGEIFFDFINNMPVKNLEIMTRKLLEFMETQRIAVKVKNIDFGLKESG